MGGYAAAMQGMNFLTAMLLSVMQNIDECAFWCLVCMLEGGALCTNLSTPRQAAVANSQMFELLSKLLSILTSCRHSLPRHLLAQPAGLPRGDAEPGGARADQAPPAGPAPHEHLC